VVEISKATFEGIKKHAERGYPNEICGVMIGAAGRITEFAACRNLNNERAHDRYELDPLSFNDADEEARKKKLDIIGIYHSHPDHPPRPSETDRVRAWGGWEYLIISIEKGVFGESGLWRLNEKTRQFEKRSFCISV